MRKVLIALLVTVGLVLVPTAPAGALNGKPSWTYGTSDPQTSAWHCTWRSTANYNYASCVVSGANDYAQSALLVNVTNLTSSDEIGATASTYIDGGLPAYFPNWGCDSFVSGSQHWMRCFTATVHMAGSHTMQTWWSDLYLNGTDLFVDLDSPTVSF